MENILPDILTLILNHSNNSTKFSLSLTCKHLFNILYQKQGKKLTLHCGYDGELNLLKWALDNGCKLHKRTCEFASGNGHLNILKYLYKNDYEITEECFNTASQHGHLHILKWVHRNNVEFNSGPCVYSSISGQLKIFKWLYKLDHTMGLKLIVEKTSSDSFNKSTLDITRSLWKKKIIKYAVLSGNLDLVKYLIIECKFTIDKNSFKVFSMCMDLNILKWFIEVYQVCEVDICLISSYLNDEEIFRWSIINNYAINNQDVITNWISHKNIKMLLYSLDNGYTITNHNYYASLLYGWIDFINHIDDFNYIDHNLSYEYAAKSDTIDSLNWLEENSFKYTSDNSLIDIAATNGNIIIIKWLIKRGYKWSDNICKSVTKSGSLECLKWFKEKGCVANIDQIYKQASLYGYLHILEWGFSEKTEMKNKIQEYYSSNNELNDKIKILGRIFTKEYKLNSSLYTDAAENDNLRVIIWLREKKVEWDPNIWTTLIFCRIYTIKWCIKNECPIDYPTVIKLAEQKKQNITTKWLEKKWDKTLGLDQFG